MADTTNSEQAILNRVFDSTNNTLKVSGGNFHETFIDPDAANTTAVHAAAAGNETLQTINTAITQPDFPRALTITESGVGVGSGNSTITGTGVDGATVTETLAVTDDGTTTGAVVFATVTSYTIPAAMGATSSLSLGTANKLGMARKNITFVKSCVNDTNETIGTTNSANGTITPTTAPDGVNDFDFWYKQ